jgi:energy-coupling factor transport system substrate-specific component
MSIAIVLDIVIGQLASTLKLPLYLDSIGTIMVGVLAGPLAGGVTGVLSKIIWAIISANPTQLWFAPVALVIGVLAGIVGARSWIRKWPRTLLGGLLTGFIAALVRAPIAAYMQEGASEGGNTLLMDTFQNFMNSILSANLLQGALSYPIDQIISYIVVFLILTRLPRHLLVRFPQGKATARTHRRALIGRID